MHEMKCSEGIVYYDVEKYKNVMNCKNCAPLALYISTLYLHFMAT